MHIGSKELYNLFQAYMQKATTIIGITVGNKRSYSIYYAKIELPIATDTDTDTDTFLWYLGHSSFLSSSTTISTADFSKLL